MVNSYNHLHGKVICSWAKIKRSATAPGVCNWYWKPLKKAGLLKAGSIHALRHSFAKHLLDKGTEVTMIMKLLGHNDIKTTLSYLHITNRNVLQVISPLDGLNLT